MNKRIIEYEVKLEKSVKIILAVLAIGVLLNTLSPIISAKSALAAVNCIGGFTPSDTTNYWLCQIEDRLSSVHSAAWDISNGRCENKKICDGR